MTNKSSSPLHLKSPRWKRWLKDILVAGVLVTLVSIGLDLWRSQKMPSGQAPALTAVTLDSQPVNLIAMSYKQPIVLYFWATWCPACKFVSPTVNWISKHFPVVSVALQSGSNKRIQNYMNSHGYTFPVINDEFGAVSSQWAIIATPTLVILKNGQIESVTTGVTTPPGLWLRIMFAGM